MKPSRVGFVSLGCPKATFDSERILSQLRAEGYEITPSYETRQRPTPMAVYQLLPRTNCRQCGEPTCFSFALKLAASQSQIADCPPLCEAAYADRLAALEAIVIDAPATG